MTKLEILNLLTATEIETNHYFDLTPIQLTKTYSEGKWNIRQILHHLTDVEFLFLGRLKKIIAEPKQVIWAFDQDEWNRTFDYINEPLTNKKELYAISRHLNYELIEKYFNKFSEKEFVHNETGLRTLQMEFEKVALHNQTHNEQIRMALIK